MTMNPDPNDHANALAQGKVVDVTRAAIASGFPIRMYVTKAVFDAYLAKPKDGGGPDEAARLQMFFFMLRRAYQRLPHPPMLVPFDYFEIFSRDGPPLGSRVPVNVMTPFYSRNHKLEEIHLLAACALLEIDGAPQPAITVMMESEGS